MTQTLVIALALVTLVPLLHVALVRDTERARERSLGGWIMDLTTGQRWRSRWVPYGTAYAFRLAPLEPAPLTITPEQVPAYNEAAFRAELYSALPITPPAHSFVTSVVP